MINVVKVKACLISDAWGVRDFLECMMRRPAFILAALALLAIGSSASAGSVKEDDLREHIEILASDEFGGREPGTPGETKTIDYIARDWASIRLMPAAKDGSWFNPVPLVERSADTAKATFYQRGRKLVFADSEIMLVSKESNYQKKAVPVIFSGYGINAEGKPVGDVAGKLVLILTGDAAHLPADKQSIRIRRNILVEAGAEAIILIANGEQGSWPALRRQAESSSLALQSQDVRAPLYGAVSAEFAVGLATAAKLDWDKLIVQAMRSDFGGVVYDVATEFDVSTNVRRFDSYNVIGKIPGKKNGKKQGNGSVVFMGHWDHLGICRPESEKDRICNGAIDNASGIAVLSEVARRLGGMRHDRDIYFVATTAEESGLLGAYSFAENPPMPLEDIVISMNVDTIAVGPRGAKVAIIGRGETALDGKIEQVARGLGRKIDKSKDANAFIRRQDGWALAAKGVPAVMVGGAFSDITLLQSFLAGDYHGPDDELTDKTDLGGAAEDADLHIALGKFFASKRKFAAPRPERSKISDDEEKTGKKTGS
jgi:hypothetical protein